MNDFEKTNFVIVLAKIAALENLLAQHSPQLSRQYHRELHAIIEPMNQKGVFRQDQRSYDDLAALLRHSLDHTEP